MRKCLGAVCAIALGISLTTVSSLATVPQEGPSAPSFTTPADIAWKDGPPSLPPGAQFVVLDGNPKEPAIFTMRIKLPADYKIPPHHHPSVERSTVLSGQFNAALGDAFDPSKGKELKAGSYMRIPAKTHHYGFTKEETVIQLTTIGPWDLIYVNPADDPRKK